jgi:outer membrane protein assembly factor BamA
MIKPRYFSVNCIRGELRGFLFCGLAFFAIWVTMPTQTCAQLGTSGADVWILAFGADTSLIQKPIPDSDVEESLYHEAWRLGYFKSKLMSHKVQEDTLYAVFDNAGRFRWADDPIQWRFVDNKPFEPISCQLSAEWYDETAIESCIGLQTDKLARDGYLEASVGLDTLILHESSLLVTANFVINHGEPAVLLGVRWEGLSKTSPQWLERVSGIKDSMVLNESNIARVSNNLMQTKLFNSVSDPEVYRYNDSWGLMYTVSERPLTFFDLIVGYVPDQTGDAVIAGSGSLYVRNAGFDGTDLKLDVERQSPRVGTMSIDIDQNLIFGFPIGVHGAFSLARQDSLWQNRSTTVGTWWDVHDNIRVSAAINREVSSSSAASIGSTDIKGLYGQVGVTFDSRNNFGLQSTGVFVDLLAESGRQIVEPLNGDRYNQNRRKLRSTLDVFIPIRQRNVIIPGMAAGILLADKSPYLNELWRIGGAQSLRGYREDQFFAKSYVWGNLEYRFMLDRFSYLFAFGSTGWLWLPKSETDIDVIERSSVGSFGMGLAFKTNLGMLKLTYAKSPEDSFSNAKVHIGISSEF